MPGTIESECHRLFVALSLPHTVKAEVEKAQNELREALPDGSIRWTRPQHFHLTLRFLGNVAVEQINALTDKLRHACGNFAPLQLRVEQLGFFPERGFPRVLWTAVSNKDERLALLQSAIQSATLEFTDEPSEKQFTGHITLGRAKKIRRREADILAHLRDQMDQRVFGEWTAESAELFRSELSPDGAEHTLVSTISFGRHKNEE